jgi:predicted O-methyltransferase YrrM
MRYLLRASEYASSGACVEVGSFRGVTTRCVAQYIHPRRVYAIDPYSGYGGAEEDYNLFCKRTADLPNVIHLEKTSGEAAREWNQERDVEISFVFVDAVHDYWNTSYDLSKWGELLNQGGILAAHDTDRKQFAGTRRAVSEQLSKNFSLLAHIENLALLKKESHRDT